MNIVPWKRRAMLRPFDTDFDELWGRFFGDGDEPLPTHLPEAFQARRFPAVNMAETEDDFCITVDLPGIEEKDVQVEAMGHNLVIHGERKWKEEKKGKEFHRVESQYGKFERVVQLPDEAHIDPKKIEASYKKGVLTVKVPKLEKTPTAQIPVHF